MPYFTDIQPFFDCIEVMIDRLSQDKSIKQKALATKLIFCFRFNNPDGVMWIDLTGDKIALKPGEQDLTADATLTMDTDVAHRFWLGKLNLIKSLTSGEIKSEGSIPKMLKLLPVIKPAFKIYPEVLKEKGLESLVDV